MVKYALILAFSYNRVLGSNYDIQYLSSSINDVNLIVSICESRGIEPQNITIVMDLSPGKTLNSNITKCNLRTNPYASHIFVCREISQFIENTVRGIEDSSYKSLGEENVEILLYFSCHGKRLGDKDQGIVLTNEDGKSLRYLLAKDIFKLIFGNFMITEEGRCEVPVYSEIQVKRHTETGSYIQRIYNEDKVTIQLSPPISSPENSPIIPYRSSYLCNRGIPVSAKMLVIVDTCYSEHMAYFPYIYDQRTQEMNLTGNLNTNIGIDLPYCVSISSCEAHKTAAFNSTCSSLTEILYRLNSKCSSTLNIAQLHYCIYNSLDPVINKIIKKGRSNPIITSTSNVSDIDLPFFNNRKTFKINVIEK